MNRFPFVDYLPGLSVVFFRDKYFQSLRYFVVISAPIEQVAGENNKDGKDNNQYRRPRSQGSGTGIEVK